MSIYQDSNKNNTNLTLDSIRKDFESKELNVSQIGRDSYLDAIKFEHLNNNDIDNNINNNNNLNILNLNIGKRKLLRIKSRKKRLKRLNK